MSRQLMDDLEEIHAARKWDSAARQKFLNHLAVHGDVAAACRAAEVILPTVYAARRRSPMFEQQWRAALECGYERLEEALLRYSIASLDRIGAGDNRPTDVQAALQMLLSHHREQEGRIASKMPRNGPPPSARQTDAALRRQLDVLAKRLKHERER